MRRTKILRKTQAERQRQASLTEETLKTAGYFRLLQEHPKKRKSRIAVEIPRFQASQTLPPSNGFAKSGFKKDPLAHKWKKGCEESEATIAEIERKRTKTAVLVNKSGYQYVTDSDDPRYFGRK